MEQKFKVGDRVNVVKGGSNASEFNRRRNEHFYVSYKIPMQGVYSLSNWETVEFQISGKMEELPSAFSKVIDYAYPLSFNNKVIGYVYDRAIKLVESSKQSVTIEVPEGYKIKSQKVVDNQIVVELEPLLNIVVVSSTDTILTIKAEYLEKLKALGVYDKWLSNVKAQYDGKYRRKTSTADSFYDLLEMCSFRWDKTPEGHNFWEALSNS